MIDNGLIFSSLVALAHMDDTENALRAYGQAIQLNT